jgi:hypothetical protein
MIKRLLLVTCAAYLMAAFAAYAQDDASRHDNCGADPCPSDAYDIGYHDGYNGDSFSSSLHLQNDPQYVAGFSEGEMDAMAEKDPLTSDGRLSSAMDRMNTLATQDAAEQGRLKAPQYLPPLDEGGQHALSPQQALVRSEAEREAQDPRQGPDLKTSTLGCQTSSLNCTSDMLDRQTDLLNLQVDLPPGRVLQIETGGFDQARGP